MEWFRQWLIGITVAAMLNAAAKSLMPKGVIRQIGGLTGGLVVLLAILQPVYQLEEDRIQEVFSPYIKVEAEQLAVEASANADALIKHIIETQYSAYIQDKAKELGLECRITVVCTDKTEGYPYPKYATIEGRLGAEEREALSAALSDSLGIPPEYQIYTESEAEK